MAYKHWVPLVAGLAVGLMISGRYAIRAQERAAAPTANPHPEPSKGPGIVTKAPTDREGVPDERHPLAPIAREPASVVTLGEALLRPYRFPFARPTSLEQVCDPDDPVQLDLDGVRLKTGLKLLLDQVGLTYRLVAEDNLIIITDQEGSEDSADRIWAELRALHRDLHAVQDAVDDLGDVLGVEGGGPRVRKPTIIEDIPENNPEKPGMAPVKPGRGGDKPEGAAVPEQGARALPSRVPLSGPPRTL
jgi:hypothetical protein